jgi:hypothetical protein
VKRLAVLAAVLALPGCYLEPINQRPSVSIRQLTNGTIYRGADVQLEAVADDPDGDAIVVKWRAFLCTSGVDPTPDCDPLPFSSGNQLDYDFTVQPTRADGTTPVQAVRVLLDANDDRGAEARPEQELVIAVGDEAPELTLRKVSVHDFVVGAHVQLFADVTDPDDSPAAVTLGWTVFSPMSQPASTLTPLPPPTAQPDHRGEGKSFLPEGTGDWDVRVTATDELGSAAVADFDLVIVDDEPPCIAVEEPLADGSATLPLYQPTTFSVPSVTDDLDSYPPVLGDPDTGAAQFSWSLQTNGGVRAPLAVTGDSVALDPADFAAGDILELRVEVNDRQPRAASFAACQDAPTCSFNAADPTCTQRQTWHMEVQ